MATQEIIQKRTVTLKLNNGTKQGVVQTVNVSLGSLDKDEWDGDKATAIIDLIEPCLSKSIEEITTSTTARLMY